jgi:ABC-type nitrate/sulfonate/bicarbonate transport system permease component
MGTLWSVIIATDNGVRNVPPIFARAARTMGSKGPHTWFNVILPALSENTPKAVFNHAKARWLHN